MKPKKKPRFNVLIRGFQDGSLNPGEEREFYGMLMAMVLSILKTIPVPNTILCDPDDLASEGVTRALEYARDYDEDRASFLSFAFTGIRGSMVDYVRRQDPLSRNLRQAYAELEAYVNSRQNVTDEEILENTSLTKASLARLRRRWDYRFPLSLDREVGVSKPNRAYGQPRDSTYHEVIGMDDEQLQAIANQNGVMYAISRLPTERERDILIRYHVKEEILREIGKDYNLTEARISQIRKKSEQTLRRTIKE